MISTEAVVWPHVATKYSNRAVNNYSNRTIKATGILFVDLTVIETTQQEMKVDVLICHSAYLMVLNSK